MKATDPCVKVCRTAHGGGLTLSPISGRAPADSPLPPEIDSPSPTAVALVEITPDTVRLTVGATRTLSAVPRAVDGRALSGKPLAWRSSDAGIARVDDSGNVTALREGSVMILAGSEGKEGTARIEVSAPPAPPAVAWVRIWGGVADRRWTDDPTGAARRAV